MSELRYVVLRHDGVDQPHFDLMFETTPGSQLATWRSSSWPIQAGDQMTRIRDHRPFYLTYEGALGGDRGSVHQISAGTYRLIRNEPGRFAALCQDGLDLELALEQDDCWVVRTGQM